MSNSRNDDMSKLPFSDFLPIESEIPETYRVRIPAVVEERRNKRNKSFTDESEYFTVSYKEIMTRKKRSIFLQTILDSVVRKENFVLNLAEYMIIEDLVTKIIELDLIEREDQEKYRLFTEDLVSVASLFLKVVPLSTKSDQKSELPNQRDSILLLEKELSYFQFSEDREYGSRQSYYFSGRLVEFTVEIPLSIAKDYFYVPYSSYCKGYGESHPKKIGTSVDWEIDGEEIYNLEIPGSQITIRNLYPIYVEIYSKFD